MMKRAARFCLLAVCAVAASPQLAHACAVCYGASDGPQTRAMNMAIMALLFVIGSVLASLAAFFMYLRRMAKLHRMPAMDYVDHIKKSFRSEDSTT